MYSEHIMECSLEDVVGETLAGIQSLKNVHISAKQACGLASRLGTILPLPLAVALMFGTVASAKLEYFVMDLTLTLRAKVLNPELAVRPFPDDVSCRIKPSIGVPRQQTRQPVRALRSTWLEGYSYKARALSHRKLAICFRTRQQHLLRWVAWDVQ